MNLFFFYRVVGSIASTISAGIPGHMTDRINQSDPSIEHEASAKKQPTPLTKKYLIPISKIREKLSPMKKQPSGVEDISNYV